MRPTIYATTIAAKLNSQIEDIDLNLDDFVTRVNADLVGKLVNIASRCAGFINKRFDHQLADRLENQALFDRLIEQKPKITQLYENRQYSQAIRLIMSLADAANQYIDERQPWVIAKQAGAGKSASSYMHPGPESLQDSDYVSVAGTPWPG